MTEEKFINSRDFRTVCESYDLAVVGGGLAGVCCAITAARKGIKVCLVQDRPVLGGNASSEVRVWALGATSHMGNNNRWSREGGVIDEILTENVYRNKEGNPLLFDMLLIDKIMSEQNITLHLNTTVYGMDKSSSSHIERIYAINASSETKYDISATIFVDASGDGVLGYIAGASYRMGAEDGAVYSEGFAPDIREYGELLGDTIFFYMKDTGREVEFKAPDFALKNVEDHIAKIRNHEYFSTSHHGCKYWWLEYGGRMDTIHDTEKIKFELWRVVYGIWDYIKNSGKFSEMKTYTLEWAGLIPGKRESRRFVGKYTLSQGDIVAQKNFYDAVSYGGWAVDLHPADGIYAQGRACNQWHSKGIYSIPLRCFVGNDIENLMFAGRIVSSSHVANGSMRVMCTCAHGAQAVGMTAALCVLNHKNPAYYTGENNVSQLQLALEETGQFIPGFDMQNNLNKLLSAKLSVSSEWRFRGFPNNAGYQDLSYSTALLLPVSCEHLPAFSLSVMARCDTELKLQLRVSEKQYNFTPDTVLEEQKIFIAAGPSETLRIQFETKIEKQGYIFICLMANPDLEVAVSNELAVGITTVYNHKNSDVSNYGLQEAAPGSGFDSFEFWCPRRRPDACNLALEFAEPLDIYSFENLRNTYKRPYGGTNCWTADDSHPRLDLSWDSVQQISEITLFFDTDFDAAMETVQMGHSENVMPQCVNSYRIYDGTGALIKSVENNHQAVNRWTFDKRVRTKHLRIELDNPEKVRATLYNLIIK